LKNWAVWLTGLLCIVAVLVFFWPTPYRYDDTGLTRVNRFTGEMERAGVDGWTPVKKEASEARDLTVDVQKAFDEVVVVSQDFHTVTVKNPTAWTFVLVENAQADFDAACGGASDYLTFPTAERPLDPQRDRTLHLGYPDRLKTRLAAACGNGKRGRALLLIVNSASHPDGRRWDNVRSSVARKFEGQVDVPGAATVG
jgi:hypothetical protein